jgi:hypothetical protein
VVSIGNELLVGRVSVELGPLGPVGEMTQRLLSPTGVENGSLSPTLTLAPDSVLWPRMVT